MANRIDIPTLTGLRFFAALFVCLAHAVPLLLPVTGNMPIWQVAATRLSAEGMTLFFVLSGFVIHYNYSSSILASPSIGLYRFVIARFARLYPLYFVCLSADWIRLALSSQLHTDFLRAIPYFLTLTMSWIYSPIHGRALIYQFGQMPSVSWSISTEWFFYLAYPAICFGLARMNHDAKSHKRFLSAAAIVSLTTVMLIAYASINSSALNNFAIQYFNPIMESRQHNDSFYRWLVYFSPYSRISEFMLGCIVAAVYLRRQNSVPSKREERFGLVLLIGALTSIMVLQYAIFNPPNLSWLAWVPSLHQCFGFAPSVAIIIYCCARYQNYLTRFFAHPFILLGGEVSYSFYLLHSPIITLFARHADKMTSFQNAAYDVALLIIALAAVFGAALLSYRVIEVPARRWLRNKLMAQDPIAA